MPNVAIYARVSTSDQSCSIQLDELRGWCARHAWTVYEEYIDHAVSGGKSSRPALDRMMADAHARRFDTIVVTKIDRFGRSFAHLTSAIEDLDRWGVRFIATQGGIDTDQSNPISRLILRVLSSVAEFERELIRERTKAGVRHAMKNGTRSGKAVGRPRVTFDRDRARELRGSGMSLRKISAELRVSYATLQGELSA